MKKIKIGIAGIILAWCHYGKTVFAYDPLTTDKAHVKSALGDIPIDINALAQWFFTNMLGIIGAIALLLMVFASFKILASSGDPNKIKEGRETFTSVISGLIFIILSLFLLKFIGIDILYIPGLTK